MVKQCAKNPVDSDRPTPICHVQNRDEGFNDGLSFSVPEETPLKMKEPFWGHGVAYEAMEWSTPFQLLVAGGIELPSPEELDDAQLTVKLWEVIQSMAKLRMFLYSTDHLSDRELYEILWHKELQEECPALPADEHSGWHIDLVSSGSEKDTEYYLRYYADEKTRDFWTQEWPNDAMPDHQMPPYDRDRHLPKRGQDPWMRNT